MKRHLLSPLAIGRARKLRHDMTDAERRLWLALREGLPEARFRRQVPLGAYFVDFCSHKAKLVVEVDGSQHGDAWAYDEARTLFLNGEGYRVLRFWNNEVLENLEGVLTAIVAALPEMTPRKRVREEHDGFLADGRAVILLPPCGGERCEAAAVCPADHAPHGPLDPGKGAGDQSARTEGPPCGVDSDALRALAGREQTSLDVSFALRASSLGDDTPLPLPSPTRGEGEYDNLRLESI
jgi:very-short-patch-repair endonuclease